ncbi:hypothetical protein C2E23DRAFT_889095 [Lenzites betulinus]|nr:hypothetical protein C2E23DRAFT_889095 [Lenzites betulinus]
MPLLLSNATAVGTMSFAPPPSVPALDNTLGAILLGTCVGLILYGLLGHQTYRYFRLYPNDVPFLKVLVAILIYYYLTTNYNNPPSLLTGVWTIRIVPVVTGTVIFFCHGFYVRRVYLIRGLYRPLIALVITLMLGELALAVAITTKSSLVPSFAAWEHFTWIIAAGYGCAVGNDLILTSSLIWVLRGRRTGFKKIISTMSLIFCLVYPDDFIYVGLTIVAAKCYANSVLAVLNSRRSLAEQWCENHNAGTFGMSALDADDSRPRAPIQADIFQLQGIRSTGADVKTTNGSHVHRVESSDTFITEGKETV